MDYLSTCNIQTEALKNQLLIIPVRDVYLDTQHIFWIEFTCFCLYLYVVIEVFLLVGFAKVESRPVPTELATKTDLS